MLSAILAIVHLSIITVLGVHLNTTLIPAQKIHSSIGIRRKRSKFGQNNENLRPFSSDIPICSSHITLETYFNMAEYCLSICIPKCTYIIVALETLIPFNWIWIHMKLEVLWTDIIITFHIRSQIQWHGKKKHLGRCWTLSMPCWWHHLEVGPTYIRTLLSGL